MSLLRTTCNIGLLFAFSCLQTPLWRRLCVKLTCFQNNDKFLKWNGTRFSLFVHYYLVSPFCLITSCLTSVKEEVTQHYAFSLFLWFLDGWTRQWTYMQISVVVTTCVWTLVFDCNILFDIIIVVCLLFSKMFNLTGNYPQIFCSLFLVLTVVLVNTADGKNIN